MTGFIQGGNPYKKMKLGQYKSPQIYRVIYLKDELKIINLDPRGKILKCLNWIVYASKKNIEQNFDHRYDLIIENFKGIKNIIII